MLIEYGNTLVDADWQINEKIPPGYSRVYYVYGGEVVYEDDTQKLSLKPGYLYIFPSASRYQMNQNRENRLHCTFFHLDVFPALITEVIETPVETNAVLKHLLLSMAASIDTCDIQLTYALTDVFELYCKTHDLIRCPIQPISHVMTYIADQIRETITIKQLSGIAGYNEQYFIRLFKKTVGLTPYQYIVSYRLKEAKKLLKTDISVTQIAAMTGYSDVKSFSRSFKENFSISPTDFRHAYTAKP